MQFMVSVMADEVAAAAGDQDAIDVFNDRLKEEGLWVLAGGLGAPATATVVDARGTESVITDGPFLETKEFLLGFWIIEAPDLDVVLKLVPEASKACNAKIEVRPFQ